MTSSFTSYENFLTIVFGHPKLRVNGKWSNFETCIVRSHDVEVVVVGCWLLVIVDCCCCCFWLLLLFFVVVVAVVVFGCGCCCFWLWLLLLQQ